MNDDDKVKKEQRWTRIALTFDITLIAIIVISLVTSLFFDDHFALQVLLASLAILGLIPVATSAIRALVKKNISIDLLATIALVFSLLSHEWFSAAFITLMLAFARIFEHLTENKAKNAIRSLMKHHVEIVRVTDGENIRQVHISNIKIDDKVIVETGDRIPVDGIVISGQAAVDESTLTGESDLVAKQAGDRVFTTTINQSGSLIVKVEKIGKDTTLARIIALVEEAGRDKTKAEKSADRFARWYISLSLLATIIMYFVGISPKVILSVLLVVCADDIAVAVPLAFTAAIAGAARRGVVVKGSAIMEQLSRVRYILTDKTGTLTRGKPKIVNLKIYDNSLDKEAAIFAFAMGSQTSHHAVSKAIIEYAKENKVRLHAPNELQEVPGQGIKYSHEGDKMLLGRYTFLEKEGIAKNVSLLEDIEKEEVEGRGIVCLAINGRFVAMMSYRDELRPKVQDIISETKRNGVREWHMLTGDNTRAASAIARELGLGHYHANMTPEGKVDFIRKFEQEHHHGNRGIVAYMGDGVNDAASLALADVSIAMGGIGADSAIEASDITIMKDNLERLPEMLGLSKKTMMIMRQNFGIWTITNTVGLALVVSGLLGPAGAATYNFLTDFIPIGNALRAGRVRRK